MSARGKLARWGMSLVVTAALGWWVATLSPYSDPIDPDRALDSLGLAALGVIVATTIYYALWHSALHVSARRLMRLSLALAVVVFAAFWCFVGYRLLTAMSDPDLRVIDVIGLLLVFAIGWALPLSIGVVLPVTTLFALRSEPNS